MNRILKSIVILSAIVLFQFANAQVVSFVKYGVENGLIQSQVQTICQDDDGRLWVGTISGVSIYDGITFENFTTRDSLAENWVSQMYKSSNGDMWLGHWAGSITRWSYKTKQFEDLNIERFNQFSTISAFVENTDKRQIVFGSKGSGLFIYHIDKNEVTKVSFSESEESKNIIDLFVDGKRNLWVSTENDGIYIFSLDAIESNSIPAFHLSEENGLTSDRITDVAIYNNEIWVGTYNKGVDLIIPKDLDDLVAETITKVPVINKNADNDLPSNNVSGFLNDKYDHLWIGTRDRGVSVVSMKNEEYHHIDFSTREGLSFYDINCMYCDREKSVWLGTNVGLNQYISDYFLLFDKTIGLPNNIVQAIENDGEGNIWLGTNSGITQLVNGSNPQSENLKVQQVLVKGLEDVGIRDIYRDSEGVLWIANSNGMLFKRNKDKSFEKVNIEGVLRDLILSIIEDNNGNIWLGTRQGVAKLNKKTYKLDFYSEADGLGGRNVSKIVKDQSGNLWMACSGGYLTMYDGENFKIFGEADGVKPYIICVEADDLGNIYFGAYTGGLYKYDGKIFINYNIENSGLRSETPYALIADDENNIWIGTSYGVEKFNPRTETFVHYGKTEGFLGLEVNYNAIDMDENNNIWFGTILGAVRYNPSDDFENDVKPIVKVPAIEINQEPGEFPFDNVFSSNENDLTFIYKGVSLNNSNKVRYQYMLEGYDNKWSKPTDFKQAFFSNLDPGKYSFKVKALNSYAVESDVFSYDFKVKVPWYMAWWFYAIQIGVVILMLIFAIFYGRKTGGSRTATVLATIALIIIFEYGINFVEDNVEDLFQGVIFIKVGLNVLLALMLFPVEDFIKGLIVSGARANKAKKLAEDKK